MELIVIKELKENTCILNLSGDLDISTSDTLDPYLKELNDIKELIIDFSELAFIDSTGIGAIVNAIYLSEERNFTLKLRGIDTLTDQVFQTVGLYHILEAVNGEVI